MAKQPSKSAKRSIRIWRSPDFGSIELHSGAFDRDPVPPFLREGEYSVGLIERGIGRVSYRGVNDIAPPRRLLVVQPGEVLASQPLSAEGWSFRRLYVSTELFAQLAEDRPGGELPAFDRPFITEPGFVDMFLRVTGELERQAVSTDFDVECAVVELMGELTSRFADGAGRGAERVPRREHRAVRRVRDILHDRIDENVSLDELAAEVRLSKYHLLKTFRDEVGMPPHAYQTQLRLGLARELLAGGHSPAEVAIDAGFADQSHLGRHFKRAMGVTPRAYADEVKTLLNS